MQQSGMMVSALIIFSWERFYHIEQQCGNHFWQRGVTVQQ